MSTLLPTSFTMKPNFFTAASVLIDIAAAQACDKASCVSELSKKVILSLQSKPHYSLATALPMPCWVTGYTTHARQQGTLYWDLGGPPAGRPCNLTIGES